ncbi:MAG: cytochrome P450 [Frankiaceae bacterium]|nr:cytochrome P450 [Frankiaceae bacterium]MBV9872278.1 cytochrome P450 [Frankiaceae bacterium]
MTAEAAVAPTYDPYDYAIHEDPYPTYAALRELAPVYFNEAHNFWALSRHADVVAAFRDADRFSSADGVSLDPAATGPHAHKTMSFLAMDQPRHGKMRRLVSKGFTPRRVQDLEPRVRAITDEHLAPALELGTFDFIDDLAGKVPMDVVSELLGVPPADRTELRRLADLVVHRDDGVFDVPPAAMEAAFSLAMYYVDLVAERRKSPKDDLISALLDVDVDGERLSDDDLAGFVFLMVVAGNETTTKLLGHCWYWAWKHPEQLAKPLADPARIVDWVEETVRFDASTQMLARTTTAAVDLHGVTIPAGGRVLLLLGSGNRDDRVFVDPDRYDLDRDTSDLLSFGNGRHFCLGASLARLEARVVLEQLLTRVAGYDIAEAAASRVHSINVRGFAHLPTTVRLR